MNKNKVKRIICGILYNHSFKLLDSWGSIADEILYENKYFNSDYFPIISGNYSNERYLSNESSGHSLKLTHNNLIYTHVFQNDYNKELSQFWNRVKECLIPTIIEKNNLIISRVGIVYICEIPNEGINEFASKYFKETVKGISDFRFSKKEPSSDGRVFKGTTIYSSSFFMMVKVNTLILTSTMYIHSCCI